MIAWQTLVFWLHIAGASVWVLGSVALGVTAVAMAREGKPKDPGVENRISSVGRAFGWVLWPALAVTIGTGAVNFSVLFPVGTQWLRSPAGPYFLAKFVAVGILLITAGAHSFLLGPRIRRLRQHGAPDERLDVLRRWSGRLGVLSVVAGLAAVVLAVIAAGF